MGSDEAGKLAKTEKRSPPSAPEQMNAPPYPDWAAIQAYYGAAGVPPPPPYFNPGATSGHHPHPYMWAPPQHMMPPYGPYAAMYSHGGIYVPPVSLGPHGHGMPASPATAEAATPLTMARPIQSPSDEYIGKKIQGSDGSTGGSQSVENGTSSSNGSEGSTGGNQTCGKKSPLRKLSIRKPICSIDTPLELGNSPARKTNISSIILPPVVAIQTCDGLPSELRDERELKRQRRKQSNRESARRSRMKKQAESELLTSKVEVLESENLALKSELNRLEEEAEKLRLQNAALMEKVKAAKLGGQRDGEYKSVEAEEVQPLTSETFLSLGNTSTSHEPGNTKLHELLKSSPRADAVVAG